VAMITHARYITTLLDFLEPSTTCHLQLLLCGAVAHSHISVRKLVATPDLVVLAVHLIIGAFRLRPCDGGIVRLHSTPRPPHARTHARTRRGSGQLAALVCI
jgi:hypothetical protein